jgi:hypothetical protein
MPVVKKRLLPAVAGVLVAAGLALPGMFAAAAAAPASTRSGPVKWSGEGGPVPKAIAHTAPALTTIAVSSRGTRRLLFWTGPSLASKDFQISYQTSISLRKNLWSAPNLVDSGKATTNSRPAATPDPAALGQVIVVWKDAKSSSILYSVGQAGKSTKLSWGAPRAIPGAATSNGPAAFSTFDSGDILIVWKDASSDAIDFVVGTPLSHGIVKWGKVGHIPGAATTTTPAVAEVATGKPIQPINEVYVLWKTPGSTGLIDFAFAADSLKFFPKWTKPGSLKSTIKTSAAPSAEAVGAGDAPPLLVVYTKPGGSTLEYVTIAAHGAVTGGPFRVPRLQSTTGTTIDSGVVAAEAPAPVSAARTIDPDNIFYLPFVRPCAGCRPR